jgi:hypothetical protein
MRSRDEPTLLGDEADQLVLRSAPAATDAAPHRPGGYP